MHIKSGRERTKDWLFLDDVVWIGVEGIHGDGKVRGVNLGGWLVVEGWIKPSLFDDIPNGDMLVSLNFSHNFEAFPLPSYS